MLDHVTIRVSDLEASLRFYRLLLGRDPEGDEFLEWDEFSIAPVEEDRPLTRHLHIGFTAESRHDVDSFWRRGVEAGYRSDGEPGLRPQYDPDYYGGFLLDPDGNSVEACTGFREGVGGALVDHLWLGVRDLAASRRFWETVAPALSLKVSADRERRFHVWRGDRSFALVADGRPPSENVHLAFPVPDAQAAVEFHRIATEGGYRDNGAPGERPQYHPGYFGGFVLDPDGNNVEAVCRHR
jgi:catechol 2,3-dioxygenase-like lactoylglutathione lyase family enzyme